jgi:N-methylhydantoinase A
VPDPIARQSLFDPATAGRIDAPVYLRKDLQPGVLITGPALITEDQTTTVVTSRFDARIDTRNNIVLTRRSES